MDPPTKIRKIEGEPERDPDSVIRFEVKDVSKLDKCTREVEAKGLPWKIRASRERTPFPMDHLQMRITCLDNPSRLWHATAEYEITLVNSNPAENAVYKDLSRFQHDSVHNEHRIIGWKELIDETKGFIKNNAITLEVRIWVMEKTGFRTNQLVDFDQPTEPFHDVTFLIAEEKIHASKQFLAIHSPVFKSMLFGPFQEKDKKEIPLEDIDPKEFREMLQEMYPSEHQINDESVGFLLMLADRFQIKMLLDRAESYLVSSSTALENAEKLLLSDKYRLVKLQGQCLKQLKWPADIREMRNTAQYDKMSDALKATMLEIMCELTEKAENSDYDDYSDYN